MGTAYSKDERVDIYMQLEKPIYKAGQKLEGKVHLHVKHQIEYDFLSVVFSGHQYCLWYQQSDRQYADKLQERLLTYKDQFIIQRYERGIVQPGNYTFRFAFVIPVAMPGSFQYSDQNYIRYKLTAILNSQRMKKDSQQICSKIFKIIQLPSIYQGLIQSQNITICKSCCCFSQSYGVTKMLIRCNKSVVNPGDIIEVDVSIDNKNCSKDVQGIVLSLQQWNIMSANGSNKAQLTQSQPLIILGQTEVKPRTIQNFSLKVQIPYTYMETAFGTITAIWFELKISGNVGYCSENQPQSSVKLFISKSSTKYKHAFEDFDSEYLKIDFPKNWNPIVSPVVFHHAIKPYIYQPRNEIYMLKFNNPYPFAMVSKAELAGLNSGQRLYQTEMKNIQGYRPSFNNQKEQQGEPQKQIHPK